MPETTNFQRVKEEQRVESLSAHFAKLFSNFESDVFDAANHFSIDYDGGYWEYFETVNGAFFMVPPDGHYRVLNRMNYFKQEMTAEAFGIALTMFVNSQLSCKFYGVNTPKSEEQAKNYHKLRDAIDGHPEEDLIFAFLD